MLFYHILQGYGGVLRMLPLGALPTHGRLTGLAVEFHHLWEHRALTLQEAYVYMLPLPSQS